MYIRIGGPEKLLNPTDLTHRILQEDRSAFNCARFIEIRLVIYESLKVVFLNVFFRFFYIVHADKGFVVGVNQ